MSVLRPALRSLRWLRPCLYGSLVVVVIVDIYVRVPPVVLFGVVLLALSTGLVRYVAGRARPPEPPPLEVAPPVGGRWNALNSPADKVPSHGIRAYGQAYAIDVVSEPEEGSRPGFGFWPVVRPSGDFPAYGQPVLAVADATVVRVRAGRRDQSLSRNSWLALIPFFIEGAFRDLSGPGALVGNHVILDLGGGTYALYAHLQRGSATVREGQKVSEGQEIARVGNSGNSTEPHLHFQLMDDADPHVANGVPFSWRGIGVPKNDEPFTTDADADGGADGGAADGGGGLEVEAEATAAVETTPRR
ncbi:M23 family metallopeptidase [Streptomyces sp. NPDC048639]|uniref:M23 family metallopeptidase n=1 Tax=Streptomyces sp. NPDC048639 TaxID=3365581 RepID=UPI0037122199